MYKYIPPPLFIRKVIRYQNINKDKNLRNIVTNKFLEEYIIYLNKKNKQIINKLNSEEGYDIIYNILRIYVKRYKQNWYDLERQKKSVILFIKKYLK